LNTTRSFQRTLLAWFDRNRRDLPWRRTRDPYRIWISEVMLQQTQVTTVIPYYERFLKRFPNVARLAQADLPEVLSLWSGLGYYARARGLHRAAGEIVQRGGVLPSTARELRELPGFGAYTAGAVASIAFGESVPVVDGNVARVLARYAAIREHPQSTAGKKRLWDVAGSLVPTKRPGDFNQALMELGALVCVPRNPICLLCPLFSPCAARKKGLVEILPVKPRRKARRRIETASALVVRRGQVLIARRSERGLFGGLWELPSVPLADADPKGLTEAWEACLGLRLHPGLLVAKVDRVLTHRDLTFHVYACEAKGGRLRANGTYVEARYVRPKDLKQLGMSSAMSAALEAALRYPPP
jgi:A/G-specific adenine glycosylase